MPVATVAAALTAKKVAKRVSKKGRAEAKEKKAGKLEKKAARKDKKAARLEKRAARKEAKGKTGKAAKLRGKAAVKSAKGDIKREKAAKKTAKAGALRKKVAEGKTIKGAAKKLGGKVKAKAEKVAGKAKKVAGKAKTAGKEVKKRAKAVVSAASGQPEMGKQPAMMKDMKQAAKNVKAGFEYGAKSFADEASQLYKAGKKKAKSAVKSVVDAKNRTFGTDFIQDNIVKPVKSDVKSVSKKLGLSMEDEQAMREAKKEERGKGANLGSMSDGNAMARKSMPMMRAGMKGGPSMMKIQYGNQASGRNMSNYTRQNGRPGMSGPGMILSKHMKGPKMGHKK
jgi:hypothetical protein